MKLLKKIVLISISILLILIVLLVSQINNNIKVKKQNFQKEAGIYLKNKYSERMVITDDVIIGDERSVRVYWEEKPEIEFFVRKGKSFMDTFLSECLKLECEELLLGVFSEYEPNVYVSDLMWCNPTPNGEFETFSYLDKRYGELGRILSWKDINEYQKIEKAEVLIKSNLTDNEVDKAVNVIKEEGCHIHVLTIKDVMGIEYKYIF